MVNIVNNNLYRYDNVCPCRLSVVRFSSDHSLSSRDLLCQPQRLLRK